MEGQKTAPTPNTAKSKPGNGFAYGDAEIVVRPQFKSSPVVGTAELKKTDNITPITPTPAKRTTLSGKQIAYLLDLDANKKKEPGKEILKPSGRISPRRPSQRAPSVAEMLKAKRLDAPSVSVQSEAVSSSGRPITVKKMRLSPGAKVINQMSQVINVDSVAEGSTSSKTPRTILNPIELGSTESDSSDDEFLKNFGVKRKTKRTASELECVQTITIDPSEIKPFSKTPSKPITSTGDSPIRIDLSESHDYSRKAKRLKTQSDCVEITGVTSAPGRESRLSFSKSPERLLGDASPAVASVERQGSDSQNELMELGFTKREHGDSQPDSQSNSQGGSVIDLVVRDQGDKRTQSAREPGRSILTSVRNADGVDMKIRVDNPNPVPVPTTESTVQDTKIGTKVVPDVKLLQHMTGPIDPATLAKNIPPQYVMVIKPNKESLLKGKTTAGPENKDTDLKILDNAIKIVQRSQLPPHRVISVPTPSGSEKGKPAEANVSQAAPTTLPAGMITVSRAGQATAITIPQPIQIVSSLPGQMPGLSNAMPVVPSVLPPGPKIKVMTSASIAASTTPLALNSSTQNTKPAIQTTTVTSAVGIQKARVINVSSGTVTLNTDMSNKLTYAQQFQAVHRALPSIVKVQPVALIQKPVVPGSNPQAVTTVQSVFSTTTKPVAPEPVSMLGQKGARILTAEAVKKILEQQQLQQHPVQQQQQAPSQKQVPQLPQQTPKTHQQLQQKLEVQKQLQRKILQQQQQQLPMKIKKEPGTQEPTVVNKVDKAENPLTIDETVKSTKIPSVVTETASSDHPYGSSSKRGTDWSHLSGRYRVLPTGLVPPPPPPPAVKSEPGQSTPTAPKRQVKSGHPGLKSNPTETNPYMEMVAEVEQLHLDNPDGNDRKVEQLRRDCRMLFAVVLFSSEVWGHNQKRKGIYKKDLKSAYSWPDNVPYCSLNNTKLDIDEEAPRARKEDLVQIFRYLLNRYRQERRHELFTSKEARNYFRDYDPLDLGPPRSRLSNITISPDGTVKPRDQSKKLKQNFSEYLKELTLTSDTPFSPGQMLPTKVEYQSDEELNKSGSSPRHQSRKTFHSAPVSPPQSNKMDGIELLLAASEALSAEQKGEQERIPRPPFSLNRDSPDTTVKEELVPDPLLAALQLLALPRLRTVKTEPADSSSLAVDMTVAQRAFPTSMEMASDDSQHSGISSMESDMDIVSSQESQASTKSLEAKPEIFKDFSKRLSLSSPARANFRGQPGVSRKLEDLASLAREHLPSDYAQILLRIPDTTCPMTMRKGGLSYYATTVLGNSTLLKGPESDVELWIPGDVYCTVIGCVHTNTNRFHAHIDSSECLVGPVPDFNVHYRKWKKSSNPLASFTLKVPHCMREQHQAAKLVVRKGDVHNVKNFKEELPERSKATVGEAFYEVDRDYISIHTQSFSQFICTACDRSWSCAVAGTALVFGAVQSVGSNSHTHIRPYICSPLYSIQDYKKELKNRLKDLQCPRRLLQDRRIDFPSPLVQINKSEVELELNVIKDENPEYRWMPSRLEYKNKLSSVLGYEHCHSCRSNDVNEVTEFTMSRRKSKADYFEGLLTIKVEGQMPLTERSGLENAASAHSSNRQRSPGRAVYRTTSIPILIGASKNTHNRAQERTEDGAGGDHCSQLSAKLIAKLVRRVFTDEWSFIQMGLHLDIPQHELKVIKTNNPNDIRMAGYTLLNQWLSKTTDNTQRQRQTLAKVLKEMELYKTAEELGLLVRNS